MRLLLRRARGWIVVVASTSTATTSPARLVVARIRGGGRPRLVGGLHLLGEGGLCLGLKLRQRSGLVASAVASPAASSTIAVASAARRGVAAVPVPGRRTGAGVVVVARAIATTATTSASATSPVVIVAVRRRHYWLIYY